MSDLNFCCLILSLIFSVRQNRGQIYHLGNPTCPAKYNVDEKIIGCQEKLGSNISDSSLLLRRPAPLFLSSVACWAVVYMKTWKIYGPPALVHMKKGQCGLLTHTDHLGLWSRSASGHQEPFILMLSYQVGEQKTNKSRHLILRAGIERSHQSSEQRALLYLLARMLFFQMKQCMSLAMSKYLWNKFVPCASFHRTYFGGGSRFSFLFLYLR